MSILIGYESLEDRAGTTLLSGQAATVNPVDNLTDRLEFDFWQIDVAAATPNARYANATAQPCDYAAIHAHDLNSATDTWSVQYSDDGIAWVYVFPFQQVTSGALFKSWTASSHIWWRVLFQRDGGATTFAPMVGIISIGTKLDTGEFAQIGYSPTLSKGFKTTASVSVNGAFLGRAIQEQANEMTLSLPNLSTSFVRTEWMPFHEHAKRKPFFISWDEANNPEDAAFCWVGKSSDLRQPAYSTPTLMDVSLKVMASI
jgi:hypothetical protein